jgi:hypothetical protein
MCQKFLKGEVPSHHSSQRQVFDELVLVPNMQAVVSGIQVEHDAIAHQLRRDVVAFEIKADHAMTIDFALQMEPIKRKEPPIGINAVWESG